MASSSSSELCGVCLGSFRDARVLPCLHSLCKECVDQLAVTATDGDIRCPICRWTFRLLPGGAAALPTDLTASVTAEESLKCTSCVDDGQKKKPSILCKKCRMAFCDTHTMAHILSTTSSGEAHLVVPISLPCATGSVRVANLSDEVPLCTQHNEPLKFHCGPCDASICGDCTAIGDHQGHKPIRYIKDIVQERKRQVGQKVERLENDVVKTVERSLTKVDNVSAELSIIADQVRADIREAEKKAIDMVKAHARQMIQDVEDLEKSRHKILDLQREELKTLLDAARNASCFSGRVMELQTTREETLFSLLEALETRTTGLLSTHINEQPQIHSRLMFEATSDAALVYKTKESIGKVLPCETSAKHSEIKGDTSRKVKKAEEMIVTVRAKDSKGEYVCKGGDAISTRCRGANQALPTVSISDNGDGSYALSCVCSSVGSYQLEVYINGEKLANNLTVICVPDFTFDLNEKHSKIHLNEDKHLAILDCNSQLQDVSILGNTPMRHGEYTWKLKIGGACCWTKLGLAAKPLSSRQGDYQTAYCWDHKGNKYYRDGIECSASSVTYSDNDTLQLHLDCARHILQITNLRTRENSAMTNLPDKEYFQYASLHCKGSSVEFVE